MNVQGKIKEIGEINFWFERKSEERFRLSYFGEFRFINKIWGEIIKDARNPFGQVLIVFQTISLSYLKFKGLTVRD